MTLAVDVSNYTDPLTPGTLAAWKDAGVGLVISQALIPPAGYPRGQTRQQIQACLDAGMPVGYYAFWWQGAGTDYLKRHLATLEGFEGKLVGGWCDVEDTTLSRRLRAGTDLLPAEHEARINRQPRPPERRAGVMGATPAALEADIQSWLDVMAQFPTLLGEIGLYSGPWYWAPYLGNPTSFSQRNARWWTAQYDGVQDPNTVQTYGGWSPPADLKQYAGSTRLAGIGGIDLSVLSDAYALRVQSAVAPVAPVHAGAGVNVDALNPAGKPSPADLKALGMAWVRLVSRHGVEPYVHDCQAAGLKVLAVVAKESGGYVFGGPEIWQIGNEPDATGPASWTMTPDEYVQQWALYRGTYPDLVMVGAGLASGNPGWWRQVAGRLQGCSAVSVHPYGKTAAEAAALLDQYRRITPTVLVTEWNRPAGEIGTYTTMLDQGTAGSWWFCHSDGMVNGFGLVDASGQPKAEYRALQAALTGAPVPQPGPTPTPTPTPDLKALADALEQAAAYLRQQAA